MIKYGQRLVSREADEDDGILLGFSDKFNGTSSVSQVARGTSHFRFSWRKVPGAERCAGESVSAALVRDATTGAATAVFLSRRVGFATSTTPPTRSRDLRAVVRMPYGQVCITIQSHLLSAKSISSHGAARGAQKAHQRACAERTDESAGTMRRGSQGESEQRILPLVQTCAPSGGDLCN